MEYKIYKSDCAATKKLCFALKEMNFEYAPVILCIGSDTTISDSLGPIVGSKLQEKALPCFIYGTLSKPITAKEIESVRRFVASAHPYSPVLVIDAAVTESSEKGYIKFLSDGIKPGLGINKDLPKLGDCSIIAIVCEKKTFLKNISTATRLGEVYRLADTISEGVLEYFSQIKVGNA
ncbi:MAG: spore protease YyaC [Christensenellaceae bacterium]